MKFITMRNFMAATAITLLMILSAAGTVLAGEISGQLDHVSNTSISGWAFDSSSPNTSATVQILVKKQGSDSAVKEFTAFASSKRSDVQEQKGGNAYCGFSAEINWSDLDDGTYDIEAYVKGSKLPGNVQYKKTADGGEAVWPSSSSAVSGNMKSLGLFKTTGYCPCYSCSEGWGRHTSTGAIAQASHTIAVDPRVIPYGSKVMIGGVIYTAEDKGGGVRGNHIDIFFNTHGETRSHGTRTQEVFLLQ